MICIRRKIISKAGRKLAYVTYEGNVFPCASTKNNEYYKIRKIDDIIRLEQYIERKRTVNDISFCKK